MIEAVFVVPVGPNDRLRAVWPVRSIRKFCSNYRICLLLDGFGPSELHPEIPGNDVQLHKIEPGSGGHFGRRWFGQARLMQKMLDNEYLAEDVIFVRIDSDAVIMRSGFIARAKTIFASRPSTGLLGQNFSNILGGRLHNRGWERFFRLTMGWRGRRLFLLAGLREKQLRRAIAAHRAYRHLLKSALEHGYVRGEFPLGGCYVVRREVIDRMREDAHPLQLFFEMLGGVEDDVLMAPVTYAFGFSATDDVSDGGLFAIEGKEPRLNLFLLKARGHYVFHPFKYGYKTVDRTWTEEELAAELIDFDL